MRAEEAITLPSVRARLAGKDALPQRPEARKRWLLTETTRLARRFREMDLYVAFSLQSEAALHFYPKDPEKGSRRMKTYTATVQWLEPRKPPAPPIRRSVQWTEPIAEHAVQWAAAQMVTLIEKGVDCSCFLQVGGE